MSDNEAGSDIHPRTAGTHAEQQLWDEDKLKEQRRDLDKWIGLLPTTSSTNTEPASVQSDDAIPRSTQDSKAGSSGNARSEETYSSNTGSERIFVPEDRNCGIWHDPPNKKRHASFGEGGTTGSANCYGNLMQMSQYLGAGNSGVFAIDQDWTRRP